MTEEKYSVILADPPWHFKVWNEKTGAGRSASRHYKTMGPQAILDLPILSVTDKNCALFLWATWPQIFDAEHVIKAWGFTYRTLAWVWVKTTKDNSHPATGMGYYTRSNSEPCLLAVRGSMPVAAHDVLSVIMSPRGAHSAKPAEQYAKIERLYPGASYLELFARERRPGWDAFGNEIEGSIEL